MSPLDPATLDSPTPRTFDGRSYPEYLRRYEEYDSIFLPIVAAIEPATFDEIGFAVQGLKKRSVLPQWLSSAEWRGLVERRDTSNRAPRTYALSGRGRERAIP